MTTNTHGTRRPEQAARAIHAKRAVALALLAALAAGCVAAPPPAGAGSLGSLDLVGRGDGSVLPVHPHGGRRWVVGTPGQEYAVRVCNSTGGRMLAVISVDGVNVVTGDTASPQQSGYVLSPFECTAITGWRKSLAHTASFYFTELPDAYAARTGRPENVGVVGVAFFPEKRPPVAWRERSSILESVPGANAPAPAPAKETAAAGASRAESVGSTARDQAAPAPAAVAPLAKIGTGHGRTEDSPTRMVRFERASDTPGEMIAIHYDRRENLVAMGVLPPPVASRSSNPFPAWTPRFVPDPPAR